MFCGETIIPKGTRGSQLSFKFTIRVIYEGVAYMKSIKDDFCGYLEIENNKYTYNISNDLVTVLPAQSESRRIYESFCYLMTHNTDVPEYFYGVDDDSEIAILRKGKFVTSPTGIGVSAKFRTPIIVRSSGNADDFCNRLTAPWNKFHGYPYFCRKGKRF